MTAGVTLRLTRTSHRSSRSTHGRTWNVLIDGAVVGPLAPQQSATFAVSTGSHHVRVLSSQLLYSPEVAFEANDGQVVDFTCYPKSVNPVIITRWLVWLLISLVKHDRWIGLEYKGTSIAEREHRPSSNVVSSRRDPTSSVSPVPPSVSADVRTRPDAACALIVEGLSKHFGERTAFTNVYFDVGYGEVFGFLGPNGAGKTTTVRTLGTLISPTSGTATVAGVPLRPENGVEIRQHVAIMPEAPGLYLRLTAYENLEFFAGLYGLRDARSRIESALAAVNLSDRSADLCGGLSKGLRQRVGLARTLLSDPTIMFLDEPTSGLDPVAALEVHNLILDLRTKGVTIFITTHRLDEAEKLCDRVAIMNTTLRTVGTPKELRERLFKKALIVTTLAPLNDPALVFNGLAGVESWQVEAPNSYALSVIDPNVAAPEVARALVGADADVLSIGEAHHSLEDVYLELVDQKADPSP